MNQVLFEIRCFILNLLFVKNKRPKSTDYNNVAKYDIAKTQYDKDLKIYEANKINYNISYQLNPKATFHHYM